MSPLRNWFRPEVLKMKGYTPGEQPKDPKTLKLNTNENPYAPPQAVLKAVRQAADAKLRLYPEPTAETLRKRLSKLYRWPLEGILVGNGSDEILSILFRACVGKGDLAQYPDLTYSLYPVLGEIEGARLREVKLDSSFGLDFGKLNPQARLTLLGYPNPPVGNCFPLEDIEAFCRKARGLVLIDEAYVDFARTNCLALAKRHPNVIVLRTLSKSFSLAGARLGLAFGHPRVMGQLYKVKDSYNVNRLTQALGLAAFSPAGIQAAGAKVSLIKKERERLGRSLRALGFTVPQSQTNFLLAFWKGKPDAQNLYKKLKKNGVLIRYFSHPRLKDALRITVGKPEETNRLLAELVRHIR
ncbi:MAG TPA: histidinol-phosphate transaminase [bacterium]|nr:histidinol-phosphate transaminase [bacterium]